MTVQLYQGDCLEIMKSIPDKSVDAVITSPPFNLGNNHHTGNIRHNPYEDDLPEEKYQQWQTWRQQLLGDQNISSFSLGFKLTEAPEDNIEQWQITFILISKQDPYLRLELD